jgi:branched-chain amino acid transport system substrate-binding protein
VKAHWTLIVGGVAALLLAGGCQAAVGPAEEVAIGADLELCGQEAAIGLVYKQALDLKVAQINEEGRLGNRKLTLVPRDNRSEPATSATNITTLAADKRVKALITGVCDECVVGAAKAINDAKIPTIALAHPGNVAEPVAERKYIFKLATNAVDDATVLVSELEQSGLKKIAVVYSSDQFGKEQFEAVKSKIVRGGGSVGSIVFEEVAGPEPEKQAALAGRLVKAKADATVILSYAPVSGQLAKSVRDAGFAGRILFGSAAADNLFLGGDTATAMNGAGMVFTPTLVSDGIIATSPAKANRAAWFRDYLSKFGTYGANASFAADAVDLIVEAIIGTDSTERDTLRATIETARMDGLSGPIRLTPSNHSALMPQAVVLLVAANGRWQLAS